MNRLLIVQPSFYVVNGHRTLHKTRRRPLIGLPLPYLAALTPPDWRVELVDEQIEDVDFDAAVDLVAITTWTINSDRAFDIAKRFRDRGVPVIMGGPHTFFNAEEAAAHCDAVGVGEGEYIWAEMLADAAAGRLRPIYKADRLHDLKGLPVPRFDLMTIPERRLFRTYTVQTSRGCPFRCEFCSERFYVGERYRQRPPEEVVAEITAIGAKNVFFADSMFAGKKERAMELMEALIPLKIRWSTLWTTYLCLDEEFMDLAKRSGLLHVNMGMESIDPDTLAQMNKKFNKVENYQAILDNLRKRGISYSLNFVFGFDGESSDVYRTTLDFLEKHRVPVAYFYILEPQKGTPFYERMKAEDRIIFDPSRPRFANTCMIRPDHCTPEELEARVRAMYDRFYSLGSMVRRLPAPTTQANIASWFLNFSQRRLSQSERNIENFDWA